MSKPSGTNSPTSSSVKPFRRADCEYETELEGKAEETSLKVHKATAKDSKVLLIKLFFLKTYIVAVIAVRIHLFPFRTEKLSSPSPMVLPHQVGE